MFCDVVFESVDFIVGCKNVGFEYIFVEFLIGFFVIFLRFFEKKDVEKIYGGKSEYCCLKF